MIFDLIPQICSCSSLIVTINATVIKLKSFTIAIIMKVTTIVVIRLVSYGGTTVEY